MGWSGLDNDLVSRPFCKQNGKLPTAYIPIDHPCYRNHVGEHLVRFPPIYRIPRDWVRIEGTITEFRQALPCWWRQCTHVHCRQCGYHLNTETQFEYRKCYPNHSYCCVALNDDPDMDPPSEVPYSVHLPTTFATWQTTQFAHLRSTACIFNNQQIMDKLFDEIPEQIFLADTYTHEDVKQHCTFDQYLQYLRVHKEICSGMRNDHARHRHVRNTLPTGSRYSIPQHDLGKPVCGLFRCCHYSNPTTYWIECSYHDDKP